MENKAETIDFDLSKLSLTELIKVYNEINAFIQDLEDSKITIEKKEDKANE